MLLEDVFCTDYHGGESCKFYADDGETNSLGNYTRNQPRGEINESTPSMICVTIETAVGEGIDLDSTHMDFSKLLGGNPNGELQDRWAKDFVYDNYDCFAGCLRVQATVDAVPTWKEVSPPSGHWGSVYPGVKKHRTGRTGAFIRPHPC